MENNIETGITETEVTETKKPHVVTLDNPLMRGEQKIGEVTVSVDALIKVLPRMTYPALTEHEIARLDASDLMQFAAEVIGFLSPSSAR
ncbi:hypothetical protein [Enterobacter hormaechei]|uniref:hypothetical protein n=1 Tax=Enterobacter hormaechei TaxID=158836 RepID=UPI00079A510B|nr:hypothetical protein [Enterobacter hormaechei]SAI04050.1 Tail E family protein [Enterobacter hormaechei]